MGGQVVLHGLRPAAGMRENMIGLPPGNDLAAADMTTPVGFAQDRVPIAREQNAPSSRVETAAWPGDHALLHELGQTRE